MSRKFEQHRVSEFVPMQETADSIWEMLARIDKLSVNNPDYHEYRTLLNRVRTQSFCMQGILDDEKMKRSPQYRNLLNSLDTIMKHRDTHPLVKDCIINILPILTGNERVENSIKYNGNAGHGSGNIISAFYKSQNYIDERERFAQAYPEQYAMESKFDIHGKRQGLNTNQPNHGYGYNDSPKSKSGHSGNYHGNQNLKLSNLSDKMDVDPQNDTSHLPIGESNHQDGHKTGSHHSDQEPRLQNLNRNKLSSNSTKFNNHATRNDAGGCEIGNATSNLKTKEHYNKIVEDTKKQVINKNPKDIPRSNGTYDSRTTSSNHYWQGIPNYGYGYGYANSKKY